MSLKHRLVEILEDGGDNYISGSSLASGLSVSRSAVWKAVEALRAEGCDISAVTNRGYRLESSGDALSASGIERCLATKSVFAVDVRKTVPSTNTALRELAAKGTPEGYVIAAEGQTAGKGRLGREFHSPAGHGVYFSLLLRPVGGLNVGATLVTPAAAVAAARAIESVLGIRVGIKWVNDLFLGDKKVCGILTEATFHMESGTVESAVLGIGLNITKPEGGYPDAIRHIAAPLTQAWPGRENRRCRLIASTLDNFWAFYRDLSGRAFLDEYRERSIVLGRRIYVLSTGEPRPAEAIEIDDECRLVVRYDNGDVARLGSGEVSIRLDGK